MRRLNELCQQLIFSFSPIVASARLLFLKFYLSRPVHPALIKTDAFTKFVYLHLPVYYLLIFNLWLHMTYWHLCFFFFVCVEFLVFAGRSLWREIWVLRVLVLFLFIAAFWTHIAAEFPDDIDMIIGGNITRLSFGLFSAAWLASMSNSVVTMHWLAEFAFQYFLVVYLPILLVIGALFAPLISTLAAMLLGHRLGYVLVGRFACWCIFFSTVSFWYLWLIYPIIWWDFMSVFGQGKLDSVQYNISVHDEIVRLDVVPMDPILLSYTDMTEDSAFLLASASDKLYLPVNLGRFISTPLLEGGIEFLIDSISLVMVSVITLISFFVHLYSSVYMGKDPHIVRFYGYLSLFTFFMLMLVMASNMVVLYIGWEGVGLSSYLLISFWYSRAAATKAATKAMLINKIGDMFLLAAASIVIYFSKGSTAIAATPAMVSVEAFTAPVFGGFSALDVLAVCLVVAAFVKSAQIFFHTWLADAMEGPTPVSALLHAATMVTAGVYLVIRFSIVIEFSALAKLFLTFGGFFTVIVSSCIAITQYDIKKIIAYSTCSQLGLMFFSCGLSGYDFALYHFFNHAFFKCLLFLLAGVIIHELANEQDIRRMGGLWRKMPVSAFFFGAASFSLAGLPGFSGAASKDYILALGNYTAFYVCDSNILFLFFLFFNFSIYLTAFYSLRLFYYIFMAPASLPVRSGLVFARGYVDASWANANYFSIFVFLGIMSVLSGIGFKMQFVTGNSFFDIQSEIVALAVYDHVLLEHTRAIVFLFTLHAFLITICAVIYASWASRRSELPKLARSFSAISNYRPFFGIFKFFNKKCYFDEFYNLIFIRPIFHLSYVFNTVFEGGIFNFFSSALWRTTFLPWLARFNLDRMYMLQNMYFSFGSLALIYICSAAMTVWL